MSRIDDGHSTKIYFDLDADVAFWEKTVTPPGIDGGGENDTSTMHNTRWRTRAPKHLQTLTEMSANCAYDPEVYDSILNMINRNQIIIVEFPDGATLEFWGWLNSFEPGENSEGEQPTADVTIIPSNQDNAGNEVAPNYTAPPGTATS